MQAFIRLGALAALAGSIALSAQQPTFRSAVHYVRLDVVVTDADDRPIRGLTRDDFRIVERGRPQAIEDFEAVEIPVGETPVDLDEPPDATSDVATNGLSPTRGRAIVIVVDDTDETVLGDIVYIKRVLSAMLGTLSADDYVAFTYVRRSDLGQDFTNDPAQHVRAVNRLSDALGLPGVSRFFGVRDMLETLDNVTRTLAAARQPRKSIVLIATRGCNPRDTGMSPIPLICRRLVERANEAGTPIYAIDPTGDLTRTVSDDPLQILAGATGGLRYRESQPWLSPARAMADNGSYYLLGYYPEPLRTDGKFQPVEVTVSRPGAHVRARKGYVAPWWNQRPVLPQRAMAAALAEGLPNPDLPIRAFLAPLPPVSGRARTAVTIEIAHPRPERGFVGGFSDEWRVGIVALDPDGRTKASFQRPVTFTGTWRPAATGRIVINEVIDAPSQALTFRIGVTSQNLSKTGTAHISVPVPDFTDDELRLGGVVIGTESDVVDAIIGFNRLADLTPIQPTTRRTFSRAEVLQVFSRATWAKADESATFELGLVGQGTRVLNIPAERTDQKRRVATLNQSVSLDGLPPGRHVLRVAARLKTGEPIVRQVPFEIR
jgi:VWFA-related protein